MSDTGTSTVPPSIEGAASDVAIESVTEAATATVTDAATAVEIAAHSTVDLVAVFSSLDFYIVSIGVFALITSAKQAVKQLPIGDSKGSAAVFNRGWANFCLHLAPQTLGALFAMCPGIFDEYTTGMRLLLGVIAGFFSEKVVYKITKQFFPNAVVSDKDDSRIASEPAKESNAQ